MKYKNELNKDSISSINLAIENPDSWFLSDDDKAILYAVSIGLNVMSSVRVIEDAAVEGEIKTKEELKNTLNKLKNKNFPITYEMIEDILKVVENRIKINDDSYDKEKENDLIETITKAIKKIEESDEPKHPFELCGIDHYHGWYGLTLPIIEEIRLYNNINPFNKIKITQIKEKFGTLNIYVSKAPEYIHKMILKAGQESRYICEKCGARGKTVKIKDWYWTLCEEHRKAKEDANHDDRLEHKIYKNIMKDKNYDWTEDDEKESEEKEG